ncbi:MAG: condensation domain-containing protein, partial [Pseudomonadota bacterium]
MSLEKLLDGLNEKNIKVAFIDGKIKIFDPDSNLSDDYLSLLREHKEELIRIIKKGRGYTKSDFKNAKLDNETIKDLLKKYPSMQKLYLATPMQQGMLFHALMDGAGYSYANQTYCDLVGALDVATFKKAWQTIINRHDIFRTCFVGFESEQIHQLVQNKVDMPIEEFDWQHMSEQEISDSLVNLHREDKAAGFDFGTAPLMRIKLVKRSDNSHHLVWSHHHVLSDGWCKSIIFGEVIHCYRCLLTNQPIVLSEPVPYENYIQWLDQQDKNEAKNFWRNQLEGFEEPTPLFINTLTSEDKEQGLKEHRLVIDEACSSSLQKIARDNQCTMNVVFQSAWAFLLHKYSGLSDIAFGSIISGRPASLPGVEKMIGLFINNLPVRVQFTQNLNISQLLNSLQQDNIARDEFGYLPLAEIQALSNVPNGTPLFDSIIVFDNYPVEDGIKSSVEPESFNLEIQNINTDTQSNYDLHVKVHFDKVLKIVICYDAKKISSQTVKRLSEHLENILTGMTTCERFSDIDILSQWESDRVVLDWSQKHFIMPSGPLIHQLFEQQVNKHPEKSALVSSSFQMSYQQLNSISNQLARYLREHKMQSDAPVGLCFEQCPEMIIAIFGILKAGFAYVPIDPVLPEERIDYIINDAGVDIVITHNELLADIPLGDKKVLPLGNALSETLLSQYSNDNLDSTQWGM